MQQLKYKFYATILDSFWGYLNSDVVWEKYWGWSENPPHTPEQFHELQFQELIDRINRKPFDSEAADKGTAFNELVDALIENRKPNKMNVERNAENTCYTVVYNNRTFVFPISLCREFVDYFKGALTQIRVEAILPTAYGNVLVYGLIDELMPTSKRPEVIRLESLRIIINTLFIHTLLCRTVRMYGRSSIISWSSTKAVMW